MKHTLISTFLFSVLFFISTFSFASNDGYEIKIKFKNLKNTECYLGFHYGKSKYIKDTAQIDKKGIAIFSGEKELEGGIYLIVTPNKNYFELIVTENEIFIETDTTDLVDNMIVHKSEENKVFYDYLKFMKSEHFKIVELQKKIKEKKGDEKAIKELKEQITEINENVEDYRNKIIEERKELFWAKVLLAMKEPIPRDKLDDEADSTYSRFLYGWYQKHFFDNIDFSDARMLRTPLYDAKINKFMNRITIRHPDSLKFAAARVIDKSLADTQLFKYTLIKLFNKYAKSKYMGMDEVFVHLAERYYLSGLAYWSDSTQKAKIWDRVAKLSNNIIGMKAKELVMKDTSGTYRSIFDTYSEYSVLIFWDYDCGHCRKVLPILKKYYNKTDRDSLEVFAIYIGTDLNHWKDYVNENNFNWINLADPGNSTNFRVLYDIHSTPVIYLLNKNHIIEAKRISVKDIKEIINSLEKRKRANRKKE